MESTKHPLLELIEYESDNYEPLPVQQLQEMLYNYYQDHYNLQEGILSTSFEEAKGYRIQRPYKDITNADEYFEAHKVWKPEFSPVAFPNGRYRDAKHTQSESEYDAFINYCHIPKIVGREPIPSFVHHTSCSLNGFIYVLGGGHKFSRESNAHLVNSDQIIIKSKELPFPIDNEILNHPTLIPNHNLYIINAESSNVSRVEASGDVPPPLFCLSSSEITQRHIFYYGGFQFIDKITKTDDGKFLIDRDILLNNCGYVLDTLTLKFKKFELIAHPTILTKSPVTVPRFGHSSTSLNVHKCLYDTEETIPATVFIMGGYKKNQEDNFETIADLWKVEFSTTYKGKHNYLEFGETLLATPVNNSLDHEVIFPKKRAFHISEFIDSEYTFGKNQPKAPYENLHKVGIARPSSPDSTNSYNLDKNKKLNKKLVIHGGTSNDDILGDTWWFDLDDEVWTNVETYFLEYETQDEKVVFKNNEIFKCQVKNVCHQSMVLDRYILFFLGAVPSGFQQQEKDTGDEIPDISPLLYKMAASSEKVLYNRLFCLNLVTQTWILLRCYHNFQIDEVNNKKSSVLGCIGCSIVGSNSKVVFTGGYLKPDLKMNPELKDIHILAGNLSVFEFPLGTSTNYDIRKI